MWRLSSGLTPSSSRPPGSNPLPSCFPFSRTGLSLPGAFAHSLCRNALSPGICAVLLPVDTCEGDFLDYTVSNSWPLPASALLYFPE